ncbi:MAG: zinc ribbon domain-containing protein [Planctomycetota bacterium]|nr:MAG: zinc ribbon domain-containing protein [Planctomycetota bacterium]
MPTYEYECTECGTVFELFQPITEPPRRRLRKSDPKPCDCNAPVRRRIGTGGGIIFKGSGFYQTDYRSESYKKAAQADKEASAGKSDKKTSAGDGGGSKKRSGD